MHEKQEETKIEGKVLHIEPYGDSFTKLTLDCGRGSVISTTLYGKISDERANSMRGQDVVYTEKKSGWFPKKIRQELKSPGYHWSSER